MRAHLACPSEPSRLARRSPVAPTGLFERPSRPKIARMGIFDRLTRPKSLQEGSEEPFWSILGRFWVLRRVDFGDFAMRSRLIGLVRSKKKRRRGDLRKPTKTPYFTSPNACQSFRGLCVHDSKIYDKSFQNLFSSASRGRSLLESTFLELGSVKRVPEGSAGRLQRPPGCSWGTLGVLLGRSWALLGRS